MASPYRDALRHLLPTGTFTLQDTPSFSRRDNGDVEDAYRLGNYQYTADEENESRSEETKKAYYGVGGVEGFESRREMTDAIKEVNELWYPTECPICEKG